MSKSPKIFVINLKRSLGRKKSIEKQLNSLNLDYEIVEALDGSLLTVEEINKYYLDEISVKSINRSLTKEEIGCFLSHIKVHKKIVEDGIPYSLILEDDVFLQPKLPEVLDSLLKNKNSWDVVQFYYSHVYLYYWYKLKLTKKYSLRKFVNKPWGAAAYLVKKSTSQKILENSFPICLPFDDYLYLMKKEDLMIRCVHPICVKHLPEKVVKSTMQEREFIKSEKLKKRALIKCLRIYIRFNLLNLMRKFNPIFKIY